MLSADLLYPGLLSSGLLSAGLVVCCLLVCGWNILRGSFAGRRNPAVFRAGPAVQRLVGAPWGAVLWRLQEQEQRSFLWLLVTQLHALHLAYDPPHLLAGDLRTHLASPVVWTCWDFDRSPSFA